MPDKFVKLSVVADNNIITKEIKLEGTMTFFEVNQPEISNGNCKITSIYVDFGEEGLSHVDIPMNGSIVTERLPYLKTNVSTFYFDFADIGYIVVLQYFKSTGKFAYLGVYNSSKKELHEIWDEVKQFNKNSCLPGLHSGNWDDGIISVDVVDHPNRHPRLIIPEKWSKYDCCKKISS